jgi:hypothetical protein
MKTIVIVLALLAAIILGLYARITYLDNIERDYNQKQQIGVFRFDVHKTGLGRYNADSLKYAKMTMTFFSNNTFIFSMDAPFIYDSAGTWNSKGANIDEWSELHYNNSPITTQFDLIDNNEDEIYLNSMTPKHGQASIPVLHFTKIE